MSENTPEAPEQSAQTNEGDDSTANDSTKAEVDWRQAARKWERQAKERARELNELKPLAEQFTALENASKSEMQRLQESLEAANREREAARSDALRFRVAAEHGITKDDLDLLGSGDEEQLTSRANRIAQLRAAAKAAEDAAAKANATPQRPTENLRPGATPSGQLNEDDALYESIFGKTSN